MLPISKKISAYNFSRGNNVKYIVVHDVGAQSTAKNNVDYFAGGNRNASAHYFVDDTSIWQSVEESNSAWHCGDGRGKYGIANSNSIGVEMCLPSGSVSVKTEANTLELVKHLQAKYGVDTAHVVRHYDASRKNCPAQFNLDGNWARWNSFKAKLSGTPSKPAVYVPKAPSKSVSAVAKEVIAGKWSSGQDRISKLTKTGYNASAVQDEVNRQLGASSKPAKKSEATIAQEVINGSWGSGHDRINRLTKAGYNASSIQAQVNAKLGVSKPKKSIAKVAKEVINGDWGNGADRANRLAKAGFNASAVQAEVNRQLK